MPEASTKYRSQRNLQSDSTGFRFVEKYTLHGTAQQWRSQLQSRSKCQYHRLEGCEEPGKGCHFLSMTRELSTRASRLQPSTIGFATSLGSKCGRSQG
ncbi:hypothetical protein RRG08_033958 [Elysia crispata]|uniref:Uncharacterized protein n=1 Tax=Elysia crispata TaxID=231223 RepID=A0AAE0YRW6_9GAST|nr:hypothetical protein RRG08_033958 [Elysia crispata]